MFGLFSRFLKKSGAARPAPPPPSQPPPPEEKAPAASLDPPAAPEKSAGVSVAGSALTLPFSLIIRNMPKDLHGRISASAVTGLSFSMPIEKVLEQIARGSVKVPFGELRRAAPAGVFVNDSKLDGQLIPLPFAEILAQLPQDAFGRRPGQKKSTVNQEIPDIFGAKGEPLAQVRVMDKSEVPRPLAAPVGRQGTSTFTKAAAAVATPAEPRRAAAKPSAPIQPSAPLKPSAPAKASVPGKATPALTPPASIPFTQPKQPARTANPAPAAEKRSPASLPVPVEAGDGVLAVSVASIAEKWPEPIRAEIEQLGLGHAICEFPIAEIGAALKTGKVQSSWKQIRSRFKPPVTPPSPHAETVLELPLKVLAPLFMDQARDVRGGKKLAIARDIPDVFSKSAKPSAPAPAAASTPVTAVLEDGPAVVAAVEPPSSAPVNQPEFLTLPISLVCENWPDPVRKEVEFHNLSDAKLEVPFEAIEEGLKLGRLQFRWKQVCLWMRPEPPPSMTSANLATQMDYRLDLPLNFVAPLYLQHRSAPTAKKGVSIADIPDVFSTGGQPAAASDAPQPTPAISAPRTPAPAAKPARASGPKAERKPGEELAELFGEPGKRNWTPNDIVHKTTTLPGVAGALIALQDGLLVASCMPPTWKTETIAAFLPQIFGRMKQYTSELKMGDLHSVTFSVESGTLQVFNAGIIYFAALSHLDTPLPLPELTLIVTEIGRHTR